MGVKKSESLETEMPHGLVFCFIYCYSLVEKGHPKTTWNEKPAPQPSSGLTRHHGRSTTRSTWASAATLTTAGDSLELTCSVRRSEAGFVALPCTGQVQKVKESQPDSRLPLTGSVRVSTFSTALHQKAAFWLIKKAACLWGHLELRVRISVSGIREDQGNEPNSSSGKAHWGPFRQPMWTS